MSMSAVVPPSKPVKGFGLWERGVLAQEGDRLCGVQ